MTTIEIRDAGFTYPDGTRALENLALTVAPGERMAIIGQNGAGKTTAVKLLNGLLKPTEGIVQIGDWKTTEKTTAQLSRIVGYVFQNPDDQIFHNEVIEEVRFGPKNMGFDEDKVEELTQWAIELCGIGDYAEENPYNLPYSMRKFVTIASVIAMDSDVIIMDEPTAGQDKVGLEILARLLDVLKDKGKTVITITHDMEFATAHFDRIVVMANRRIIADGQALDIFYRPDILEESMLKPPSVAQMAALLGFGSGVLHRSELVDLIKKRYLSK